MQKIKYHIFIIIFLSIGLSNKVFGKSKLYLVDYDIHTAIIIEREIFTGHASSFFKSYQPTKKYFEFSIGEEPFFREAEHSKIDMIRALFWPTPSLVRLISFNQSPLKRLEKASGILEFETETINIPKIVKYLEDSLKWNEKKPIFIEHQELIQADFFLGSGSYHLFNNCNDWLAGLLKLLGIESSFFAKFSSRTLYKSMLPKATQSITNKSKASKKLKRYLTE